MKKKISFRKFVIITREEFSDDAKDLSALFILAFDLENLELLDELFLFGFGDLRGRHDFFIF